MDFKGSIIMEYMMLIIVVVIAVLFMSFHLRLAFQGHLHEATLDIGSRYEYAGKTESNITKHISRHITTDIFEIGGEDRMRTEVTIHKDETRREVDETVHY